MQRTTWIATSSSTSLTQRLPGICHTLNLVHPVRLELTTPTWKDGMLPLNTMDVLKLVSTAGIEPTNFPPQTERLADSLRRDYKTGHCYV